MFLVANNWNIVVMDMYYEYAEQIFLIDNLNQMKISLKMWLTVKLDIYKIF